MHQFNPAPPFFSTLGEVLVTGTYLEKGQRLFGDEQVTNRSHVIDKHLVTGRRSGCGSTCQGQSITKIYQDAVPSDGYLAGYQGEILLLKLLLAFKARRLFWARDSSNS